MQRRLLSAAQEEAKSEAEAEAAHEAQSAGTPDSSTPALTPSQRAAREALSTLPLSVGLLFAALPSGDGVSVTTLRPGQAAEAAGVRVGDVIRSLDGRPTSDKAAFLLALKGLQPGDSVPLDIERDGEQMMLQMEIGARDRTVEQVRQLRIEAGL